MFAIARSPGIARELLKRWDRLLLAILPGIAALVALGLAAGRGTRGKDCRKVGEGDAAMTVCTTIGVGRSAVSVAV